jgi:hypothetical protein
MEPESPSKREMLRHTVATLAYRGGKAVRDSPSGFAEFKASPTSRTPGEVLAHIGDLLDWALALAQGRNEWQPRPPRTWGEDVERFHAGLAAFDAYLASEAPLLSPAERLFQGPVADAIHHVGQINMLRRMAGAPVKGENYFKAEILVGRVGAEQSAPRREFD